MFSLDPILQAYGSQTTTTVTAVSGWIPLALGWIVALLIIGLGRVQKRPSLVSLGIVAVGAMTLVTPLAVYLVQTILVDEGVFPATPLDFLLVALISALGGGIIALGLSRTQRKGKLTEH